MTSTFFGLETAKRGMATQQGALYTTGHNISNANTPGYTRQRVNFQQTEPYPAPGLNAAKIPGQMGTGVEAGSIERVREGFLDLQYRGESNKLGYYGTKTDALQKMEDIMNEPSDTGLAKTMNEFWQALQDLSVNPENSGARSVVQQRGLAVTETFHYLSDSLSQIKIDIGSEIGVTVKEVNSLSEQISSLNKQISEVEPHGYLPNDLYDERDRLVDQLSQLVNIKVEKVPSGGNASTLAEGMYNIVLLSDNGTPYKYPAHDPATPYDNKEVTLVSGLQFNKLGVAGGVDTDNDGNRDSPSADGNPIGAITLNGTAGSYSFDLTSGISFSSGKLKALTESYGYGSTSAPSGIYPDMMSKIDQMAYSFAKAFNEVHEQGYTLAQGTTASTNGGEFFANLTSAAGAAKNITLSTDVANNLNNIAVSSQQGKSGDGSNAIALANVKNKQLSEFTDLAADKSFIQSGTITTFYEGLIGRLGVDSQQASRLNNNSQVLQQSVDERRQSVSAVSLDEEMTNMVQFQHAYNASARMITVVDEMLDKIINGMGVGGR